MLGAGIALLAAGTRVFAGQLVINEVFYNVLPQGGNQYVELLNSGTNTAYLDGKILTDEGGSGIEGVFQFPGFPGGTTLPVAPGAFVLIAVDATNATAGADWECYAGPSDTDNPLVPNLSLVAGTADLGLFSGGDNVLLADGTDTTAPIDPLTIIDAVNFTGGGGEWAHIGPGIPETNPNSTAPYGFAIGRCPDGVDNNDSSASDFIAMVPSPGAPNNCDFPALSIGSTSILEGNSGAVTAQVLVTLSTTGALPVTVHFSTSNGTATAGSDYLATNGVLSFPAGIQTQIVRVVVLGDTTTESDETFEVRLQNPTNATINSAIATVTILNDEIVAVTSAFTSVSGGAPTVTMQWTAVSGYLYRVQSSANMSEPSWTDIGSIITAHSAVASINDTNSAATSRFYRVMQLF
ncbi:MAG TPA: Calx-beta domain-containing protein [Kiritimatiellia bacterium]|nr:Calx-beta domain-containing protein [Kiritimatiellia bacterium]